MPDTNRYFCDVIIAFKMVVDVVNSWRTVESIEKWPLISVVDWDKPHNKIHKVMIICGDD